MKLSISTKLFAAVFASVLLVILAMSAATGWSFQRGFIGYLNDQGIARLEKPCPGWLNSTARKAIGMAFVMIRVACLT